MTREGLERARRLAAAVASGAGPEILEEAGVRVLGLDLAVFEWAVYEAHTAALCPVIVRALERQQRALADARQRMLRAGSDVLLFAKESYAEAPYTLARAFVEALRDWKPRRGRETSTGGRPREPWRKRLERELRKLRVRGREVDAIAAALRKHVAGVEALMVGTPARRKRGPRKKPDAHRPAARARRP